MAVDEHDAAMEAMETTASESDDPDAEGSESDEDRETLHGSIQTRSLPHRFHAHGLEWSVDSLVLDGDREVTVEEHGSGFHASLLGERDWDVAVLSGTITIPEGVYEDVVPDTERSTKTDPPTGLYVNIDCRDAVLRDSEEVAVPAGPGEYDFELALERDRLYGTVTLFPSLARRETFTGASGACASETGHRLAEATPGTLALDLTKDVFGLFHPLKRKFSEEPDFPPEEHLVHLVLKGDDAPQLFLNEDHEDLLTALDVRGTRGKEASLKEVAFDLVEAYLWPQLVLATVRDLDSEGEPSEDWQWDVLRQVAEPLYGPGIDAQEAGRRLSDIESDEEFAQLSMKIEDFVQSRVGPAAKLTTVLNYLRGN